MKSNDQILQFIADRIGHIYFRPLMYGSTPSGVDLILHYYHELWAEIVEHREQYKDISHKIHQEEDTGAANFAASFMKKNPEAKDAETVKYVIHQWMKISKKLNIPINYSGISKALKLDMP
jgi:glycerol kinase